MKIGKIRIEPMEYGRFKLDGGAMYGVVPKVLWEKYSPANDRNQIQMALRGMIIKTESRNILVDTGVGNKMSEKLNKIYAVDFSHYSLADSLHKLNLNFGDITDVILTHLHFDHTGGATGKKEDGSIVPTFPNATYYVQKKQYDWAISPSDRDLASYFPENFVPLNEANVLQILAGEEELFPGIFLIPIHGHTPGQQLVKISQAGETLLYCGDLIPTASHIPLPWIMGYDLQPLVTLDEKKNILPVAAAENWLLFFEHDPHIAAAKVEKTEKGFLMGEKILVCHD